MLASQKRKQKGLETLAKNIEDGRKALREEMLQAQASDDQQLGALCTLASAQKKQQRTTSAAPSFTTTAAAPLFQSP